MSCLHLLSQALHAGHRIRWSCEAAEDLEGNSTQRCQGHQDKNNNVNRHQPVHKLRVDRHGRVSVGRESSRLPGNCARSSQNAAVHDKRKSHASKENKQGSVRKEVTAENGEEDSYANGEQHRKRACPHSKDHFPIVMVCCQSGSVRGTQGCRRGERERVGKGKGKRKQTNKRRKRLGLSVDKVFTDKDMRSPPTVTKSSRRTAAHGCQTLSF